MEDDSVAVFHAIQRRKKEIAEKIAEIDHEAAALDARYRQLSQEQSELVISERVILRIHPEK